ncbi:MAG: ATP-dependent DNA ligase [Gemmatimonadetes bacterium]|nr:MAG: ATP-dependent DNA ligase [Gemmatimonadota bacterium]
MRLADLVATSQQVARTSGRLEKIGLLAALLARVELAEIEIATAFLCGVVRQPKLGVGYASVRAALPESAAESATLELSAVDRAFEQIARLAGKGSADARMRLLRELLLSATRDEQRFLTSLVIGEVRQGALEGLVLEAVAQAARVPSETVRRAAMAAGDLPSVARVALAEGAAGLSRFSVRLFRPVLPMLAQTADDAADAVARLGRAALEFKLDGARVQLHKRDDEVKVYSRSLKDVTAAVPELVEWARTLPARELILDGEVIALRADGTPLPFQTTMRRFGRRLDVDRLRRELPLTPFFFDLLYLDGQPLLAEPEERRFAALSEVTSGGLLVPRTVTALADGAQAFLDQALAHGHEGIMAKALDAPYEAGGRGQRWLKVKPAHTLDLVVLAAEWGHGRRQGWLSNLHLGARDPETGGFVMLGKTFKGMTDEMLAWQTKRLLEVEIGRDAHTVHVRPELVVEVAFNDVQASSHYAGGLALRFARVKRYRTDKTAAQADTVATVRRILHRSHDPAAAD